MKKDGIQIYILSAILLVASLVALAIHLEVNDNQITALDVSILCASMVGVVVTLLCIARLLRR